MIPHRLIWTGLPQGIVAGRARLTIHVAIRLLPSKRITLSEAAPFDAWPAVAAGLTFGALVDAAFLPLERVSGIAGMVPVATDDPPLGDPQMWWNRIFGADTPVDPHQVDDLAALPILSYDHNGHAAMIAKIYGQEAARVTDATPPTMSRHSLFFGDGGKEGLEFFIGSVASNFPDVQAYFEVLKPRPGLGPFKTTFEDERERVDFHQRLAGLAGHPGLLRHLGLLFDVMLPPGYAPQAGGLLRVVAGMPDTVPGALPAIAPAVRFQAGFRLAPRVTNGALSVSGLLDPQRAGLAATMVDVDGAVRKLQALEASASGASAADWRARAVATRPPGAVANEAGDHPAGYPALRTSGITLAFNDMLGRVKARAAEALALDIALTDAAPVSLKSLAPSAPFDAVIVVDETTLYAEDLTRGYRIDVQDLDAAPGQWRSLHRRVAEYALNTQEARLQVAGEGWVSASLARAGLDPAGSDATYAAHPALATWSGWSLSVPQPARHATGEVEQTTEASDPDGDEVFGVRIRMTGASGLPSLRYGRRYRFRVRAVDLTGGGMPDAVPASVPLTSLLGPTALPGLAPAAPALVPAVGILAGATTLPSAVAQPLSLGPIAFHRLEPVEPVIVAYARPIAETGPEAGESPWRLAIRSLDDDPADTRTSSRVLLPPRVPIMMAERHGILDDPDSRRIRTDLQLWEALAQRDPDGAAALPKEFVHLEYEWQGNAKVAAMVSPSGAKPEPAESREQVVVDHDAAVPYVFDPLVRYQAARFEPTGPTIPKGMNFNAFDFVPIEGETLPTLGPVLVRLQSGPFNVQSHVEGQHRHCVIALPPGSGMRVHLSAKLEKTDLALFGVYAWARAEAKGALPPKVDEAAVSGRHWMLTPSRTLDLVHAVQRPLVAPSFMPATPGGPRARVGRSVGERGARFEVTTQVHVDSTAQVDVFGEWREPAESFADTMPGAAAPLFTRRIDDADKAGFPQAQSPGLPTGTRRLTFVDAYAFADTAARLVTLDLASVTRFREYMPPKLRAASPGLTSPLVRRAVADADQPATERVWVPASARPPAPVIAGVVPTFAWTRGEAAEGFQVSMRVGGGLRIWLERPWFVSGPNEMLAVCVTPDPGERLFEPGVLDWADPSGMTRRARDPLDLLGASPTDAQPNILSRAVLANTQSHIRPDIVKTTAYAMHQEWFEALPPRWFRVALTHPGDPDRNLLAGPHRVDWDAARQQWFCDIDIDPEFAYGPFVRLALARYQPMALGRTHVLNDQGVPQPIPADLFADQYGQLPSATPRMQDLHLSDIVYLDWVQLLPNRLTLVLRTPAEPRRIDIRVYGVGVAPASQSFQTIHSSLELLVEAAIEGLDPELERRPLEHTSELLQRDHPLELFARRVTLAADAAGAKVRLAVIESETYPSAVSADSRRPVYLDSFDIPTG